jgi:hypothetical protein
MTLITNTTVGFMKQKLNKAKKYKEQERLANLAIASAWARGCTLKAATNKGACLGRFYSPAFLFTATKQGEKLLQQSADKYPPKQAF